MCEVSSIQSFQCESELNDPKDGKRKCVPTQTQVREQLGSRLSDIFFENLCSEAKIWLGLTPPLVGPETVWISPSARAKEKVVATPVPEPASLYLKALTHGSILDVGERCVMLFENKHKMEMEKALKNQAEEIEDEWRRKLGDSGSSGTDGMGQCKKVIATLMEHFEKCFDDLVETSRNEMKKECQLKIGSERAEIAAYMLSQLKNEVERRDYELCNDFHEILVNELNILANRYVKQIDQEREIAMEFLKETIAKYEKSMKDLKVEMEITNVIDLCRAINLERTECNERVRALQKETRSKIDALVKYIDELKAENCTLQKMSVERLKRLMVWKKKVHVLLIEFQRFINFALKTIPGQSEFLLSLEKLMLRNFPEDTFISPEDYQHYKDCLKDKLKPYEEEEEEQLSMENEFSQISEPEEIEGESQSYDDVCCLSFRENNKKECELNFDYDQFKAMLVKRFAFDIEKPTKRKKPKKMVCLWKKKSKAVSIEKSSEWYKILTLVGETEKEHQFPIDCFLEKRRKAILKICKDDPEFAKIILGCSHN